MFKRFLMVACVAFGLAGLVACGSTDVHHHHHGEAAECSACETYAATGTGWCDEHAVGWVDGKRVECRACYMAGGACAKHA